MKNNSVVKCLMIGMFGVALAVLALVAMLQFPVVAKVAAFLLLAYLFVITSYFFGVAILGVIDRFGWSKKVSKILEELP